MTAGRARHFLLLQMPWGRFGTELQAKLRTAGHHCTRIAFNGGDLMSASGQRPLRYTHSLAEWPGWIALLARSRKVTDLVCYGDCRAYHRAAIRVLRPLGIRVHVLDDGYLRPNWVTCERDGANGFSSLTTIDIDDVPEQPLLPPEVRIPPGNLAYWLAGAIHGLWSAVLQPAFPNYVPHKPTGMAREAALWLGRVGSWPLRRIRAARAAAAIARHKKPVHLVLLQLHGDPQIRMHSGFQSTRHFIEHCIAEFAESGVSEALLVFKNHPLDNGVIPLRRVVRDAASRRGLDDRVLFIDSGKLVPLLEHSISAISINSPACHQALGRGIPTLALGRSAFNHPQIVSRAKMSEFFRLRRVKDPADYEKLLGLMRRTSQINGGFYSSKGRAILLPALVTALTEGRPDIASLSAEHEAGAISRRA